jgi:hypothetical protein
LEAILIQENAGSSGRSGWGYAQPEWGCRYQTLYNQRSPANWFSNGVSHNAGNCSAAVDTERYHARESRPTRRRLWRALGQA